VEALQRISAQGAGGGRGGESDSEDLFDCCAAGVARLGGFKFVGAMWYLVGRIVSFPF
jgi:hypothetical protein